MITVNSIKYIKFFIDMLALSANLQELFIFHVSVAKSGGNVFLLKLLAE